MAANVTAALAGVTSIPFLSQNASTSTYWCSALAILASLLVYEQINYRRRKQHLPGPSWTIPIMGRFLDSRFPSLEKYIEGWKQGPLSVVSVFHIFIVMTSTTEFSRKVFNSAAFTSPSLVASARTVLEPDNWRAHRPVDCHMPSEANFLRRVFIHGKAHVEYRKILNTLFTRKALAMYLTMQDRVVRQHLAMWLNEFTLRGKSDTLMHKVRDINLHISLKVFCGPHIPDHAIAAIGARYWEISTALQLVNIPFAIPGTAVWRAIQSRKEAMKWLTGAAEKSLAAVDGGAEPECMLDAWVVEIRAAQASGKLNRDFTPREMGLVLLSFLFASQDAMSSGIVWLFQHMANHPGITARIRAEQDHIRGGNADTPVSLEMVDEMIYLRSCIKESLRVRPPVPMVPYWADKDFPISEDYTVPKGAMVIASVWPSCMDPEVYPEPEKFDPERWSDPNSSANQNPNKYLVFGSGPHRCIGVEYTMIHMCIVAGTAAMIADWTHHPTAESEKTVLLPTIFPKDGCIVTMRHRQH